MNQVHLQENSRPALQHSHFEFILLIYICLCASINSCTEKYFSDRVQNQLMSPLLYIVII